MALIFKDLVGQVDDAKLDRQRERLGSVGKDERYLKKVFRGKGTPFWPFKGKSILISAHGNSIRALCKYLFILDNTQISKLEIPTGNPLLIELENNQISNCKYLDQERAKDLLVF